MIFELKKPRFVVLNPVCIFCECKVDFSDYPSMCRRHGYIYYSIPLWIRVTTPKILMHKYLNRRLLIQAIEENDREVEILKIALKIAKSREDRGVFHKGMINADKLKKRALWIKGN